MNIDRQWEMARNALFRFITAIPEGDEVGIVSFGANARINIEPTEVTASNREGLYGRVPFRLLNGQQGCLECGLRMALKLLDSPRPVSNGALVVLTATPGTLTEYFFLEYLSLRKFVLSFYFCPPSHVFTRKQNIQENLQTFMSLVSVKMLYQISKHFFLKHISNYL